MAVDPKRFFCAALMLAGYTGIAYGIARHDTLPLFFVYALLFALYMWVINTAEEKDISFWIASSILIRISLILALPSLSDDVYRFLWDGRLTANGYNPFAEPPDYYLQHNITLRGIDHNLYSKLNSPHYFTVYPPLSQLLFWLAAVGSPHSITGGVVILRTAVLLAETGTFFLIITLLKQFRIERRRVLLYALNPLIILELTANLHTEIFMIFFILLFIYLMNKAKHIPAAISFGCAIGIKLVPLIFLPWFLTRMGSKKTLLIFYGTTALVSVIVLLPLCEPDMANHFFQSLSLYFTRFEFNAGLYYLIREYGYKVWGYNIIHTAGWIMGVGVTVVILVYSLRPCAQVKTLQQTLSKQKRVTPALMAFKIPQAMLWILTLYFLFTTTLHPWYITPLLTFSIFTRYRFVVLWTALIFLTYQGYTETSFQENLTLVALEYLLVYAYMIYELTAPRTVPHR